MSDRERIERLERQVRALKRLSGGLVLVAGAILVLGAAGPQAEDLKAKSLRIVDDKGVERIVLQVDGHDDAGIGFKDGQGKIHQAMATRGTGDSIYVLRDRDGELRLVWNTLPEGLASWTLLSGKPGRRVQTLTNARTGAVTTTYDVGEGAQDKIMIGVDNNGLVLLNDLTKEKGK